MCTPQEIYDSLSRELRKESFTLYQKRVGSTLVDTFVIEFARVPTKVLRGIPITYKGERPWNVPVSQAPGGSTCCFCKHDGHALSSC